MSRHKPEILLCLILLWFGQLRAQINRLPARIPANGAITAAMIKAFSRQMEEERFTAGTKDSDILGYYYTDAGSGIITGCYLTMPPGYDFEHHLLFEAHIENGRLRILNSYRLLHGNYPCCWNSTHDGFRRIGDLYFVRYCSSGSAFCAGHNLFFRRLADLRPENAVLAQMYSGEDGHILTVASRLQRRGDTLFFNYRWRSGIWEDEETLVYQDSAFFRVPFFYRNGEISTPDSAKLQQYGLDW